MGNKCHGVVWVTIEWKFVDSYFVSGNIRKIPCAVRLVFRGQDYNSNDRKINLIKKNTLNHAHSSSIML